MYSLGDRVVLTEDAKETYKDFAWVNSVLVIVDMAISDKEHLGYDEGMAGMQLLDLETEEGYLVDCSLYEYEVQNI